LVELAPQEWLNEFNETIKLPKPKTNALRMKIMQGTWYSTLFLVFLSSNYCSSSFSFISFSFITFSFSYFFPFSSSSFSVFLRPKQMLQERTKMRGT
jgi:hypothetical protein